MKKKNGHSVQNYLNPGNVFMVIETRVKKEGKVIFKQELTIGPLNDSQPSNRQNSETIDAQLVTQPSNPNPLPPKKSIWEWLVWALKVVISFDLLEELVNVIMN